MIPYDSSYGAILDCHASWILLILVSLKISDFLICSGIAFKSSAKSTCSLHVTHVKGIRSTRGRHRFSCLIFYLFPFTLFLDLSLSLNHLSPGLAYFRSETLRTIWWLWLNWVCLHNAVALLIKPVSGEVFFFKSAILHQTWILPSLIRITMWDLVGTSLE